MKLRNILVSAAVCALALPLFAGPMKAGKWQISVESKMAGMDMKMPPVSVEKCITPEEAENPQPPKMRGDDCKIVDYKSDGSTGTWKNAWEKWGRGGAATRPYHEA